MKELIDKWKALLTPNHHFVHSHQFTLYKKWPIYKLLRLNIVSSRKLCDLFIYLFVIILLKFISVSICISWYSSNLIFQLELNVLMNCHWWMCLNSNWIITTTKNQRKFYFHRINKRHIFRRWKRYLLFFFCFVNFK